jgi:hypothetical protein
MRVLLATSILASILISSSIPAAAGPLETAPPPALVHVQPQAEDFRPHSPANRAEQRRLSRFDARQAKRDKALNETLSICRC